MDCRILVSASSPDTIIDRPTSRRHHTVVDPTAVDKAIFHEELETEIIEWPPFKREPTFPFRFVCSQVVRDSIGKADLEQSHQND